MSAQPTPAANTASQRTAAIGLLIVGAALVAVSGFLDWIAFTTQDFFQVRPLSGFDDGGGGLWAIGAATVVVVLAVMLSVGLGGDRGANIVVRILWVCVVGAAILVGQAFYSVFNGSWVLQGTQTPLVGSPAAGLYLLAAGTGVMLVSIIWVGVLRHGRGGSPRRPLVGGSPLDEPLRAYAAADVVNRYGECPHCKEQMRKDATVCPHCRRDVSPQGPPRA